MPWQVHFLDRALTFDDDGLLVHRSALGSVARQNGKSIILKSVILFWLLEMPKIRGEKQTIVSVAHRLDLAVMVFDDLADILENKYGAYVSRSYGRNKVTMPDGTTWWIKAAKHNAGHGMSIDLLIVDELFDVDAEVVEGGLMPAQRARKTRSPCSCQPRVLRRRCCFSVGANTGYAQSTADNRPSTTWPNGHHHRTSIRCRRRHGHGATPPSATRSP